MAWAAAVADTPASSKVTGLSGEVMIIIEVFYAWQPFWVDITESGLYNNITTVVIPILTTVPRLLNWFW